MWWTSWPGACWTQTQPDCSYKPTATAQGVTNSQSEISFKVKSGPWSLQTSWGPSHRTSSDTATNRKSLLICFYIFKWRCDGSELIFRETILLCGEFLLLNHKETELSFITLWKFRQKKTSKCWSLWPTGYRTFTATSTTPFWLWTVNGEAHHDRIEKSVRDWCHLHQGSDWTSNCWETHTDSRRTGKLHPGPEARTFYHEATVPPQ